MRRTAWYAVDLKALRKIDRDMASEFAELAVLELNESYEHEISQYEIDILYLAFGLRKAVVDPTRSIHLPVQWICHNFGTPLFNDFLFPLDYMEVDSLLCDYRPPFGLPAGDENVAYLSQAAVIYERRLHAGCETAQLSFDEAESVLEARRKFIAALDICIEKDCDLIVIES